MSHILIAMSRQGMHQQYICNSPETERTQLNISSSLFSSELALYTDHTTAELKLVHNLYLSNLCEMLFMLLLKGSYSWGSQTQLVIVWFDFLWNMGLTYPNQSSFYQTTFFQEIILYVQTRDASTALLCTFISFCNMSNFCLDLLDHSFSARWNSSLLSFFL